MNFDDAFRILVNPQHEGGFTDNPKDPGNWTGGRVGVGTCKGTKFGISAKTYPNEDIAHLTLERAKFLYQRDFWGPAGCDIVPDKVKYELFDTAVNSGVVQAIKLLQRAVDATADGIIGPQTTLRVTSCDQQWLLRRFQAKRIQFYTSLPPEWFAEFGRGVMNRIAANMLETV